MPHISLPEGIPGIIGPMMAYPLAERALNQLAETLLRGPSDLTPAERELIAAYTSHRNDCFFCCSSHSAAASALLGGDPETVEAVCSNPGSAPVSDKLKALLQIAGKVQQGGLYVTEDDVVRARAEGASDRDIHDTVLIAAAFCMFNRYVDGLATWAPRDPEAYIDMGVMLAEHGYLNAIPRPEPV